MLVPSPTAAVYESYINASVYVCRFETQRGRDLINKNLNELMEHVRTSLFICPFFNSNISS